jgi:glycosyltransferase involved in cell wall biosynthesis
MEYPRITVVTPSYNQAQFIPETIESVLNQNYPNLEYFIVDGGSTDGTQDIIRQYEQRISWWVSEKDNGQSDALRKGFQRATGDLIGWLNSDDIYFPGALFKIAEAYSRQPEASLYIGGVAVGALHDGPIRWVTLPPPRWTWWPKKGQYIVLQQASFYRRAVYEQIGGINSGIFIRMDGDIMHRLLLHHPEAAIIDDVLGFIRWHDATKSTHSLDIYRRETDMWYSEMGMSGWQHILALNWFRLLRLVSGSHFRSVYMTAKYRGKRLADIWSKQASPKEQDRD